MTAARGTWPLVGRDDELDELRTAVEGTGAGVVMIGTGGVGRTRLAREAAALADAGGRPVHLVAASSAAAAVPLGALAHLIPAAPAGAGDAQLLQHAVDALAGDPRPPVLVVDDAHLLDPLTVTLLHRLAAARSATLVATVAAHGTDPLSDLWRDDHATRIDLGPLDRGQVEQLLPAALGGHVDSRTVEQLWRLCRGNVRVLRELVEGGRESGRLRPDGGLWRWAGPMHPTPRLTRIVLGRLAGIGPEQRAALDLLAVAGPLGVPRVVELVGRDVLAALERTGLVTVDRPDHTPGSAEVRPAHPVHALVLAAELPAADAGHIRRRVVADRPSVGTPDELLRVGRLLLEGETPDVDADVLLAAAQEAAARTDHVLAERLARAAARTGDGTRACAALVEALQWQGRAAEAEETAARSWTPTQHRLTAARALNLQLGLRRPDDALRLVDAGTADPTGLLGGTRALLALRSGDVAEAIKTGTDVLDRRDAVAGHPLAAAAAGAGLAVQGRVEEALAAIAIGADALTRPEGRHGPGLGVVALEQARLVALLHAGRIGELAAGAAAMHRDCLASTESAQDAIAAMHRGAAALFAGRMDQAARWLTEANQGFGRCDPLDLRFSCTAWLITARALLGETDAASALLGSVGDGGSLFGPQMVRARVWVAAAEYRTDDAGTLALDGAARAEAAGQRALRAGLLHDAVRLGRAADADAPLHELAATLGTPVVVAAAEHAGAVVAAAPDRLDAASVRFEELGALLLAADTAADAAAVHHRAGHRRRSSAAAARAVALAVRCGDPHTPALRHLDAPRLTARERDVARLAASGMSNQAIAHRLVVSVRTVETHLAHTYTKLGVAGRGELASALEPR